MKKTLCVVLFALCLLTGCGNSSNNYCDTAKNLISKDLSDPDIYLNEIMINPSKDVIYVDYTSNMYGSDEAFIMLSEDNKIYYNSVYESIAEDDYDKIIEYGDFTLLQSQLTLTGNDAWTKVEAEE